MWNAFAEINNFAEHNTIYGLLTNFRLDVRLKFAYIILFDKDS